MNAPDPPTLKVRRLHDDARLPTKAHEGDTRGDEMSLTNFSLRSFQLEQAAWAARNFDVSDPIDPLLGLVEEVGELSEAFGVLLDEESWVPSPRAPDFYEISDRGRIRRIAGGKGAHPGEIRKATIGDDGYHRITLSRGDNEVFCMVHVLVAEAWIGPLVDGFEVNHKDGDKGNNVAWNLEYVTPADNQRHAIAIGLRCPPRGSDHHGAKLDWAKIEEIRRLYATGDYSQSNLAATYGVSKRTVNLIVNNKTWTRPTDRGPHEAVAAFLKVQAAVGRISHAVLKGRQGIRGTAEEHRAAARDAVGDIAVYLADFCTRNGFDLEEVIAETWDAVKARDWKKDNIFGNSGG